MNKEELITQQAFNTWQALQVGLENYGIIPGEDYYEFEAHNSVLLLSYTLTMRDTSKWRTLQSIVPELTQMAQLESDDDRVRISYRGMKYRIEVPKPKHLHDVASIQDVFDATNGLGVSFGLSAYNNKPNLIDFSGTKAGHMLVSGSTRCGKTNILKLIAMMLMYKNSPQDMRIAVIDTRKARKFDALRNSAHLAVDIVDTEAKAIAFLRWVKDTLIRLQGMPYDKKIIILIDEVFFLAKSKEAKPLLEYVASAGAESGFHIIAASQYTKVEDLGGKQFKGNLMTRVTGPVDDHYASRNATGKEGLGAENLTGAGDFLVVDRNGVDRIAVPEMKDKFFDRTPKGTVPLTALNWTEEEIDNMPSASYRVPSIDKCFNKIDPRLLHLAIYGKVKGKPLGADKIRNASYVLASRGIGERIGQSPAQSYVSFAKRFREINKL